MILFGAIRWFFGYGPPLSRAKPWALFSLAACTALFAVGYLAAAVHDPSFRIQGLALGGVLVWTTIRLVQTGAQHSRARRQAPRQRLAPEIPKGFASGGAPTSVQEDAAAWRMDGLFPPLPPDRP